MLPIEERTDGYLLIMSKGTALNYKEITERPKQMAAVKKDMRVYNRPPKPFLRLAR
jgi:hypothetical protein